VQLRAGSQVGPSGTAAPNFAPEWLYYRAAERAATASLRILKGRKSNYSLSKSFISFRINARTPALIHSFFGIIIWHQYYQNGDDLLCLLPDMRAILCRSLGRVGLTSDLRCSKSRVCTRGAGDMRWPRIRRRGEAVARQILRSEGAAYDPIVAPLGAARLVCISLGLHIRAAHGSICGY